MVALHPQGRAFPRHIFHFPCKATEKRGKINPSEVLKRKDAKTQSVFLTTESTKETELHLAMLRAFKKIFHDDQKIYSPRLISFAVFPES